MKAEEPVSELVKMMAQQLEVKLRAMKAEFKIILPDGTQFGDLEVAVKKTRKPRQVRDVKEFDPHPYGFNVNWYASAISSSASQMWGNKAHQLMINKQTGKVELIRLK
jgi:hypothetical protein